MDHYGDFVSEVIKELVSRGQPPQSTNLTRPPPLAAPAEAEKSLRWFDYFVEFFIETPPIDADEDILYFVRDKNRADETVLFVKRRLPGGALPKLESLVVWEEAFYVNLIAQMRCEVRITVLGRNSAIITQLERRVFADPMRGAEHEDEFKCAYPMIYFSLHHDGGDEEASVHLAPRQTLCVELRALFTDKQLESASSSTTTEYSAWREEPNALPIFQGAVTFSSLASVHKKKVGMRMAAASRVLMKGPEGKGYAQVQITKVDAPTISGLLLRKLLFKENSTQAPQEQLRCQLKFIYMNWRLVVLDLFRHFAVSQRGG